MGKRSYNSLIKKDVLAHLVASPFPATSNLAKKWYDKQDEGMQERVQAGGGSGLQWAATGAGIGAAAGGGPIGAAIGAGLGAAIGFTTGFVQEKKLQESEEESQKAMDLAEKESLEIMQRESKQAEAAASRASAQGRILGGTADQFLVEAASTGAHLEGFKRRNFPTYG